MNSITILTIELAKRINEIDPRVSAYIDGDFNIKGTFRAKVGETYSFDVKSLKFDYNNEGPNVRRAVDQALAEHGIYWDYLKGRYVKKMQQINEQQGQSNEKLLTAAAPDMLQVLIDVRKLILEAGIPEEFGSAFDEINQVLSKAVPDWGAK